MEEHIYLYSVNIMNTHLGRLAGVSCGVIRAKSQADALEILTSRAGDNAYSFNLLDVTERNGEAYIGIPSGALIAFDYTN